MSVEYVVITALDEGQRLDNFLMRILKGVPKSHVYQIIRTGEVRMNMKRSQPSSRLKCGDSVRIPPIRISKPKEEPHVGDKLTQRLIESIIYEDPQLLVINKPAGIAVHGGSGLSLGVIEAFRKIRKDLPYLELVHRIDKETSGCLMLAKKRSILRQIQSQFEARSVTKIYWALLCDPWVGKQSITVDIPLQKNTLKSGERMVRVNDMGKASQTAFKCLENYQDACWVEVRPLTGRTHQIRVHSAALRHPILGDLKYGSDQVIHGVDEKNQRLYLHAREIQFNLDGKNHVFQSPLDERFSEMLKYLRSKS
ncbi:MAG: RluA family pseudouridine synthase [Legionellales bacterium]|nr:RluA family pseudouridine synthase [Legionellales bacterium]